MMHRLFMMGLLLAITARSAELPKPADHKVDTQPQLDYDIGEFNKIYWRWKRCMNRWEQEHGANDVAGAAKICGAEPQMPK